MTDSLVLTTTPFDPTPGSFTFLGTRTDAGWVFDELETEVEELTTPGVDARRWRTLYRQYPPFTATTWSDAATFADATTLATKHRKAAGRFGMLQVTGGTKTRRFRVFVREVVAIARPGPIVGASASGAASVETAWSLVRA